MRLCLSVVPVHLLEMMLPGLGHHGHARVVHQVVAGQRVLLLRGVETAMRNHQAVMRGAHVVLVPQQVDSPNVPRDRAGTTKRAGLSAEVLAMTAGLSAEVLAMTAGLSAEVLAMTAGLSAEVLAMTAGLSAEVVVMTIGAHADHAADDDRPSRGPRRDDDRRSRPRYSDDDRPSRGPRSSDGPSRGPRRDDDRRSRPRYSDDDRPSRGPRRDDDRPSRGPRSDDDRRSRGPRSSDGPSRGPRRDDDRRSRPRYRDDDRDLTAAQRRSREVRERTGGRRTELGMSSAPKRSREEWIDEGSVRGGKPRRSDSRSPQRPSGPRAGGSRARTTSRPARGGRRDVRAMDSVIEEIERAVGARASGRVLRRYEAALASFEAHRYSEARIVLVPLAREASDVAAIRELLGLCYYRENNWKKAIEHLEAASALNPGWIFNHAVLADCHRAVGNKDRVEELWNEIGEASPHPELLAEARIVYAMTIADDGDLAKALGIMVKTVTSPKRVQEYHLRQWYVVADLYDRMGNVIKAREMFERIANADANFADVAERMSDLGS
jgi:Tfp pilus assembly protein PilF